MKKRLLIVAFAMLSVATSFAFEVGEYATNSTQRFKITGANLVTNGNFANGLDGWYGADKESAPSADVWSITENPVGPNGEKAIEAIAATEGMPLCNAWTLEPGTYVVSYQIKSEAAGYTTIITGGSAAGANAADFFLNTDGAFTKAASTDEAKVVNVAAQSNYPAGVWKTQVYYATVEEGQQLVMHFEKLTAGIQITNIEIHAAEQVYDVRVAQNRIAFAKELMENPAFDVPEAQAEKENLKGLIETVEGMIDAGQLDDASEAEGIMNSFETEGLEPFLAVTSVDVKSLIPGLNITSQAYYGRGGIGSNAAKYKLDLSGNWGHLNIEPDVLRSAIQNGYAHSATYAAYHEDFPAGKYFFTCEIRNANTDRTSWPTNPIFNLKTDSCLMFIGTDTITTAAIEGEEFQRFSMIADVKEDGKFRAGIYWPGVSSGGAFFIRNTIIRAFNKDINTNVEHIQAFKTYMTQWNAAINGRKGVHNLIGNANYPWGQNELKAEAERLDPIFTAQADKRWSTIDGVDSGIASTEELIDWANYQGIEEYNEPAEEGAEPTRKTYQLVRGYQGAANTIKATNQIITDLGNAIDAAKKARNTGAYLTGDRDTYKTAILAALKTLTDVRATTTDATRVKDSTTLAGALDALLKADTVFLASVTNAPFIDIDFSNQFTEVNANDSVEVARGNYYIEGAAGRMYFGAYEEDNNTNAGFALGVGEEYMDVLRVGNGSATVFFDENNQPGENDAIRVSFDFYHGNLSGKFAGVQLQNAAGERVAGFYLNRYNGTIDCNDFETYHYEIVNGNNQFVHDSGMWILKYATGVGSSSASNAAIAAANNRSTYTLVIDYKNKTLQGTLDNAKNGICEGEEIPFRTDIEDQKIVKFVLISNYNNKDRRCWFDNLKISRYALADIEEDITDKTWAETTDWEETYFTTGIKTIAEKAEKVIYTMSGVRVAKAAKPGLYIVNGKKVVIK